MRTRIITGVIALPIFIFLLYMGGYYRFGVCVALSVVGTWEYCQAFNHKLPNKIFIVPMILAALLIQLTMKFYYQALVSVLACCLIILFIFEIFSKRTNAYRVITSVFGLFYVPVLFGFMILFDTIPNGTYYLWMVFIIAFVTDTAAYFVGRFFGKKKLAPDISPKKTIAGGIGGVVFAAVGMVVYGLIMKWFFTFDLPIYLYVILGVIGSIAGQCGDLAASMIKRKTEIKDFGKVLPGQGGVLDRFDSILFVMPIVYIFASFTFGYII